jgi:tetratricopeptide (TPR) repeat protein
MELTRFIFWTAIKGLGLAFLGLLAAKAVSGLRGSGAEGSRDQLRWVRGLLYAAILALVIEGARTVGVDIAAENYAYSSQQNLARFQLPKAYENALRAVELRPGEIRYWHALANAKFAQKQYASLVADQPVLLALGGGKLEEADAYSCATSYYFLAQYDKVIPLTQQMIRENHVYAAAYALQGYTYLAQKKFPDAERTFLEVLQMFPTMELAVEGLAHAHYLEGDRAAALSVLAQASKFPFSPEARQRFEALKALYAQ